MQINIKINGKVVTNAWIGDCYVNESGVWDMSIYHPQWKESQGRWWYQHSDGKYTMADWEYLEGKWYYFNTSSTTATGWSQKDGVWEFQAQENPGRPTGAMYRSAVTPDGYTVDEQGVWNE